MLREEEEEEGLGERSSGEFKGNKGDGRAEEGKGALEKRKRLTVKQRWRRGTERRERQKKGQKAEGGSREREEVSSRGELKQRQQFSSRVLSSSLTRETNPLLEAGGFLSAVLSAAQPPRREISELGPSPPTSSISSLKTGYWLPPPPRPSAALG